MQNKNNSNLTGVSREINAIFNKKQLGDFIKFMYGRKLMTDRLRN